jgi:hypothetical protein
MIEERTVLWLPQTEHIIGHETKVNHFQTQLSLSFVFYILFRTFGLLYAKEFELCNFPVFGYERRHH